MNPVLAHVFETGSFRTTSGREVKIDSETPAGQCEFLQALIRQHKFKSSIEIGLAYGTSTLAIAEAVAEHGGRHTAIDPYEHTYWKGCGLELLKQGGQEIEFHEDFSYRILPGLLEKGRKFDFAYIDSTKLTDWLMVDFFLLDKMLNVGGIIAFDDVTYPSIRKLVRYLAQIPAYNVVGTWPNHSKLSGARKMLKSWTTLGIKDGPSLKDFKLGLYSRCVALQKTGEDHRPYDWHVKF